MNDELRVVAEEAEAAADAAFVAALRASDIVDETKWAAARAARANDAAWDAAKAARDAAKAAKAAEDAWAARDAAWYTMAAARAAARDKK